MHGDRVARRRSDELLGARKGSLDRAASLPGQDGEHGLLRDFILAAEIAANDGRDDADAVDGHLQGARHVGATERDAPQC